MAERTLLSLAEEAAIRAKLPVPATIVSNNEKVARQILVAANDTIREIRRMAANNDGWGCQQVAGTVTTASGTQYYDLPSSYDALIPGANFINGNPMWFMGPTNPYNWRAEEAGVAVSTAPYRWRIKQNQIFIQPTPSSVMTLYFEYLSRAMIDSTSAGAWDVAVWDTAIWNDKTVIDRFLADSDQPRVPDDLVSQGMTWRLMRDMGQPYFDLRADYEQAVNLAIAQDKGGPPRSLSLAQSRMTDEVYHPLDDSSGVVIL
jgi:hypothetical protein